MVNSSPRAEDRPPRLHETIVQELGRAIATNEIHPGERIPGVEELCEKYEASRSTIREAIRVLSGKGLVRSRTKVGTTVAPREDWNLFDPSVLLWRYQENQDALWENLMPVRGILEPEIAALAATTANEADLDRIRVAFEEMAETYPSPASIEPDLEFHRAIALATHNEYLVHFATVLSAPLRITFAQSIEMAETAALSIPRHRAILAAIEARDPAAARAASMLHLSLTDQFGH